MGIENRLFFRTGKQWIDPLGQFACLLHDSAYWFCCVANAHVANMAQRNKSAQVWPYFTGKNEGKRPLEEPVKLPFGQTAEINLQGYMVLSSASES